MKQIDLKGKTAFVFGVADEHSIAWAIAKALHAAGCKIAIGHQDRTAELVKPLLPKVEALDVVCDVTDDAQLDAAFEKIKNEFGRLDFLIHSIAFAKREDLQGQFVDTSRRGYQIAQEVSSYSLVTLAKRAAPLMVHGGSIIAMTYYGSEKVIPNYNVMGVAKAALEASIRYLAADLGPKQIRVNGISAGPIKTMAASAVKDFDKMLGFFRQKVPLRKNTEAEEVGDTALFLCSDLSRGITGQIIYVDEGYCIMGM